MYFFGLSKEEVLSQKHVVSYKETSKQTPINMVTLFGRQVEIVLLIQILVCFKF